MLADFLTFTLTLEGRLSKIGAYLKAIREERGLTLRQVEELSGVSNAYLSMIESGRRKDPHPRILKSLATAYREDLENLMKIAGYLDTTVQEQDKFDVEELYQQAMKDETVNVGHRFRGELDFEAKRVIANLYRELKQKGKGKSRG